MVSLATLPRTPFSYADALALGVTRQQLRRALKEGAIVRLRRGWYAVVGVDVAAGERWEMTRQDHLQRVREALVAHPGCAAGHDSAAIVDQLPLVVSPTAEVELVRIEDAPSSRRLPGVTIHHTDSMETTTVMVDGIRCTTRARTAADVLRTRRLPHGLAMLDEAVRAGQVSAHEVRAVLDSQHRWVGRPKALRVLDLLDGRRESWGESYSAGVIALADLPQPIPQVDLYDENFVFVARLDGLLDHELVATESDGQAKYRIGATPDTAEPLARAALAAESIRQARIERLGLAVARWMTEEAMRHPEVVSQRIHAATSRALNNTFIGWVRWDGAFRKLPLLPRTA
ncbi:type IV toxin-antitoxin system AbiEi family antitoxin domain-containing protein [Serinicoccus kebangsaanensis]|uniref:type IV toxin-antitoxin system AbiEi family antitoxin domain-containing protein n=1 Tax=Serinicoccus kebangsaanensis TaxID=2602069 RepID=UPI00124CD4EE|nr:type IV toxin-antitoxin system AbiEi family antitoxin domain-containing protein [Serinicoccus kebangsaanensis]